MNPEDLQKSIVLITSSESNNSRFGTGFVIRQVSGTAYVLTCAHVIRDVGGTEKVKVDSKPGTVIASGEDNGLDLAVLQVYGLGDKPEINLQLSGQRGSTFITAGFQLYDKAHLIRSLQGNLGESVGLHSVGFGERVQAWDLRIDGDYSLQPGYSGSPVVDEPSGYVLGIVSHRQGEGRRGLAISIEALEKIWKFVDRERLYRWLLRLGYSRQVRLFRQFVRKHSVAALLIHGSPYYGQRWLLNLLLVKYLPYVITSRDVKVGLTRRTRKFDATALWREFCTHIQLPKNSSPSEIAQGVYKCCQTQNMILIFHNVEWMPRESMKEIIQDFWLPLATKLQNSQLTSKLFMFLVDYEGSVGNLEDFFTGGQDANNSSYTPIKTSKFSPDDLFRWIDNESDEIPAELVNEFESKVEEILDSSSGGIPEFTLDEICSRCGFNWYDESKIWLEY